MNCSILVAVLLLLFVVVYCGCLNAVNATLAATITQITVTARITITRVPAAKTISSLRASVWYVSLSLLNLYLFIRLMPQFVLPWPALITYHLSTKGWSILTPLCVVPKIIKQAYAALKLIKPRLQFDMLINNKTMKTTSKYPSNNVKITAGE